MFKLEIEVITPILRVVTKSFTSLKVMRQWQKRNDLDNALWCLEYKEYIFKNDQWEPFVVFGKQIVTLSELHKTMKKLTKSEDFNSSKILDACCGARMFWFNKTNPSVVFIDNRCEEHILCDGRKLEIKPDMIMDFTNMTFTDNSFKLVVFDPPHLRELGKNSWMAKKYGVLPENWEMVIKKGFDECMRVLEPAGILVFKWNEYQIPVSQILKTINAQPLFGHKSGKSQQTHWLLFMKKVE
jgi:ubiquinone/menaquinone biosynthesis C-methylase UbiE